LVLVSKDTLSIPAGHVMGFSIGASVAHQMAVEAPEKVLSLFMLSPPPLKEVRSQCSLFPMFVDVLSFSRVL
jgi:pimeloyl-ACP methyl ester carboxylesterase